MKISFLKHGLILSFTGGFKVEGANLFIPFKISYLPHCGRTLVFPLGTVDTILFFVQRLAKFVTLESKETLKDMKEI